MNQSSTRQLLLHFENPSTTVQDLNGKIEQLLRERGALRHITKHTLESEINEPDTIIKRTSNERDGDLSDSDEETPQARQEKLWKARDEMLQKLAYAQNEILSALDFVSLLLSGKSAMAQSSMSPALKERVPVGSLGGHATEKQPVSAATNKKLSQVSEGWKSESFSNSSGSLGQAASRLEKEASQQARYWDQIAGLKQQGWSISRLPADSRAIGIHYGSPEAAPQFRNRGFALLQQSESGDVQLDFRSIPENFTTVRTFIIRGDIQTGASRAHFVAEHHDQHHNINDQVTRVRDTVFEDELFHEINREARLIANQSVRTQPSTVEADISAGLQIRFVQAGLETNPSGAQEGPDDQLAESIALNVRLLLLLEHQKIRERRMRPPAVMTLATPTLPEYALLRPVLAQLRHQASLHELNQNCKFFLAIFSKAGLNFDYSFTDVDKGTEHLNIQRLRQPARTLLTIRIGHGRNIKIDVETYLGSPVYGTVFRSQDLDFGFIRLHESTASTIAEAVEYLSHVMMLELVSQTPNVTALRPHSGEVALGHSERIRATVSVRPQRITLAVANPTKVTFTWRSSGFQWMPGGEAGSLKTFKEVIDSLANKNTTSVSPGK